jgi:hypothetical protein
MSRNKDLREQIDALRLVKALLDDLTASERLELGKKAFHAGRPAGSFRSGISHFSSIPLFHGFSDGQHPPLRRDVDAWPSGPGFFIWYIYELFFSSNSFLNN